MIVPRDSDLESVEKHSDWEGTYFVLGGTIPILEKEPEARVHSKALLEFVKNRKNLKEIKSILASINNHNNTLLVILYEFFL